MQIRFFWNIKESNPSNGRFENIRGSRIAYENENSHSLLIFLSGNATYAKNSHSVRMFQGKKLYGRIRIVANFPDIKV